MLAASGGLWAATAGLRFVPELRARRAQRACEREADNFGEGLGCAIGVGIGHGFDTVTYWGLSYATAIPAAGLMGGAGYFFGRARRRPLPHPRATRGVGIAVAILGAATWLVPRAIFLARPTDLWFDTLNPTFYAGLGTAGLGAAVLAYAEGARPRAPRRRGARLSLSPGGVSLTGRF